jgi:hypothetical protein
MLAGDFRALLAARRKKMLRCTFRARQERLFNVETFILLATALYYLVVMPRLAANLEVTPHCGERFRD